MKKASNVYLLLAGILAGILLGLLFVFRDVLFGGQASRAVAVIGQPAPEFSLKDLDGQVRDLSEYRGKAVVLNFWATWCAPCRREMPLFETAYQNHPDELVILGVNYQESSEIAADFARENGVSFPVLLEPDGRVGAQYNVRGFPTSYFLDPSGVIRSIHIGEVDESLLNEYLRMIGIEP